MFLLGGRTMIIAPMLWSSHALIPLSNHLWSPLIYECPSLTSQSEWWPVHRDQIMIVAIPVRVPILTLQQEERAHTPTLRTRYVTFTTSWVHYLPFYMCQFTDMQREVASQRACASCRSWVVRLGRCLRRVSSNRQIWPEKRCADPNCKKT